MLRQWLTAKQVKENNKTYVDKQMEEYKDYIVVKDCPSLVVQDSLKPLQEGEKVRLIEWR